LHEIASIASSRDLGKQFGISATSGVAVGEDARGARVVRKIEKLTTETRRARRGRRKNADSQIVTAGNP
jgi:Flp pilus assembly CpaE family ATPase